MAREQMPDVGPKWLKADQKRQDLLVITEITWWISHMEGFGRKSFRCGGRGCAACHVGMEKIPRGVVMGMDSFGRERLFEIRKPQERALEHLSTMVGVKIAIRKTGAASNSKVDVWVVGEERVFQRDIRALVDTLGDPPRMLGGMDLAELPSMFGSEEGPGITIDMDDAFSGPIADRAENNGEPSSDSIENPFDLTASIEEIRNRARRSMNLPDRK